MKILLLQAKKCELIRDSDPSTKELMDVQEELYRTKLMIHLQKFFPHEDPKKLLKMIVKDDKKMADTKPTDTRQLIAKYQGIHCFLSFYNFSINLYSFLSK